MQATRTATIAFLGAVLALVGMAGAQENPVLGLGNGQELPDRRGTVRRVDGGRNPGRLAVLDPVEATVGGEQKRVRGWVALERVDQRWRLARIDQR
jgi:hypothetical protein